MIISGSTAAFRLALDASVRHYDNDGHLHIAVAHISKANVCPYYGHEIPNAEALGLDPAKMYHLLRSPDALKEAAPTFNRKPLVSRHVPMTAETHRADLTVGTTGESAVFNEPFLENSLVVWDADAIALIESGQQKELSCGYRYIAVMVAGTYQGMPYDGIMTQIVGNHVALVTAGRAGDDVVIGDAKGEPLMKIESRRSLVAKGAILAYLQPKLAMDAKIDIAPALQGVTRANWKQRKPVIVSAIKAATTGKLAADAGLEDFHTMLDSMDREGEGEPDEMRATDETPEEKEKREKAEKAAAKDKAARDKAAADAEADTEGKKREFLMDKLSKDEMEAYDAAFPCAAKDDATTSSVENAGGGENAGLKRADPAAARDGKTAMDAAIKNATDRLAADMRACRVAENEVRPFIGDLANPPDKADEIYRMALDHAIAKGTPLDLTDVPVSAYRSMVKMLGMQSRTDAQKLGMDAASTGGAASFAKAFPAAAAIPNI